MISEARTSLESVLHERVSSPFYGAFIFSWLIWNWRILYLTFFIDSEELETNKIDFIVNNYNDVWNLLWFPLISTVLIVSILPFLTNGAFYISLLFNKWKIDKRNDVEKKQLLSLEQSIQIRELIQHQEKRFESLLRDKNEEVKELQIMNEKLKSELNEVEIQNSLPHFDAIAESKDSIDEPRSLASTITRNNKLSKAYDIINEHIQKENPHIFSNTNISVEDVTFFEVNDLIVKENGFYDWTQKGKAVGKEIYKVKFEDN